MPESTAVTDNPSSPAIQGKTDRAGRRRAWRIVIAGVIIALLVVIAVLGYNLKAQADTLAQSAHQLSQSQATVARHVSEIRDLKSTISDNDSVVAKANADETLVISAAATAADLTTAKAQLATVQKQLAACQEAAAQYGAQAIANGLAVINVPGGAQQALNLSAASIAQKAGNDAGCPPKQ